MNFVNGTFKILYIKQDLDWYPIGCLTSNNFSESAAMLGTTTRDNPNGWETSRPSTQSFNIGFNGLITKELALTTNITYAVLKQIKRDRQLLEWKIQDNNGVIETGYGYIDSLSDDASIDEFTTFDGNITGYGQPVDQITTIYDTYEDSVEVNGGEITSADCQRTFIKQLLAK